MSGHWQQVLQEHWGISASLTPLDGEFDLNFLTAGEYGAVLKVMRLGCEPDFVELQCSAIDHAQSNSRNARLPKVLKSKSGASFIFASDETGAERIVWLLERIEGVSYANWKPHSTQLLHDVGASVAALDKAWENFDHPALRRSFKWNLSESLWIADHVGAICDPDRRAVIDDIVQEFHSVKDALDALPDAAIHNDVNDYNILVSGSLTVPAHVAGLIDLGDMCAAPRVCDLAIAAAYMVLDHPRPEAALSALVAGYHGVYPLTATETDLIWPLLRMRLAVSVVNSTLMAREKPDDPYVVISQRPAWGFLQNNTVNAGLINTRLRAACELPVTESAKRIHAWLAAERGHFAPVIGRDLKDAPIGTLSIEASTVPQDPFAITPHEAAQVGDDFDFGSDVWLGHYGEPRLIYTGEVFRNGPWKASDRRTVHLGVDVFADAGTPVHAVADATVTSFDNRPGQLDYGGVVVLRHDTAQGDAFFTLYGHLDPASLSDLRPGALLKKGQAFAALGEATLNGGWKPHLHFQLAMSLDGLEEAWPGVAEPDELYLWAELCPNPAALLNLADDKTAYRVRSKSDILAARRASFAKNLTLTYTDPIMFLRGWKHHLFDEWGRPYLDAYNNVPHVGHAHPRIQAVAADQLKRINSNTRYLHPAQTEFARKILSKLPDPLSVCFFVNSGSEANELALRLARAHTGGKDIVTPDHGYHGNTTGAIDISAYKFNAKDGVGQPEWVQLIEVADDYRGSFRRTDPDRADKFAALVDGALSAITARGGKLAGFIAETFPSVGGQIIPPKGYLKGVYERIRQAGGVCIADEVQTGLGRLGDYYFGFEHQDVVPDIVVMGKPIGNGHPLGVVVTTQCIANSFAQGPEYFSTFGGSNLSCRMGLEVLQIVDDEGLMENARQVGGRLLARLCKLQDRYEVVGDVRGHGLFIGVDLVEDKISRKPATQIADFVKNRMREHRILMGTEGPYDNILKIRPPLTIDHDGVDMIVAVLDQVLEEVTFLME